MKTRIPSILLSGLRLLLLLPLLLIMFAIATSCADQKDDDAFVVVEQMPVYPGGDEALLKYVAENTTYPKEAKDNNIQGRVIVRFKIKEDGTVSDASVIKGVDKSLDNEALRVVGLIPRFTPGKQNGVDVPVWYMIPVTFTLK